MNSILCIELCAGCARLSATLVTKGFRAMAVDQKQNRHKQLHPTVVLDLTSEEAVKYLCALLRQPGAVLFLHCAPPCGTCSRARERKLSWKAKAAGVTEPRPLRDGRLPEGFPHLTGTNRKRVDTANAIYKHICTIARVAHEANVLISIENPTRSWMWATKWFVALIRDLQLHEVRFQQCMHGGRRDKWTSLYVNHCHFDSMALHCDQQHTHLPWGVSVLGKSYKFNTAEEAEYPPSLCAPAWRRLFTKQPWP